jgi:hypothetical protein
MKKALLITALILMCLDTVSAQRGREFWFAVPNITAQRGNGMAYLRFVSYDQSTTIHITQSPAMGVNRIDVTHTLPPNSYWEFDLYPTYMGQTEVLAGFAQPYALHMTANADFSVYFANTTDNSEIFTLKGENALGTDFVVPMQWEYESGYYARGYNALQILATEDSTKVEVELFKRTTDMMQTADHQTITIWLDKGFAYAFHSLSDQSSGPDHLYGTRVHATKPIAVNTTDDSVTPGDLVGDQLVPSSLAGNKYIAIKNTGNIEKLYIFPVDDGVQIRVNGAATGGILNHSTASNDKLVVTLNTPVSYISADNDKRFIVYQITTKNNSNELGSAVLPKLDCTGSMETAYRPAFIQQNGSMEIYFNIVVKTAYTSAFTVNGQTGVITASDFTIVPGTPVAGEWSYCRKNMTAFAKSSTANNILRVKNTLGYFHVAAYDNPNNNSCTFGYFSDFHPIQYNAVATQPNYQPGDIIRLYLTNADAFTSIVWRKPDGTVVNNPEVIINNPTEEDAGFYIVHGVSKDACQVEEDAVVVVNFVQATKDTTEICVGESVELTAEGYGDYLWTPTAETTKNITVSPAVSTSYTVRNMRKASNIIYNGDFQQGNTYFTSDYIYGGTTSTAVTNSEKYSVWRNAKDVNSAYNRIYDHTTSNSTDGRFLIANCSNVPNKKIWSKKVTVIPGAKYEFAAWFLNAVRGAAPAKLQFTIDDEPVGTIVEPTDPTGTTPKQSDWQQFGFSWVNTNNVTITLSIETAAGCPDNVGVCIDDITFAPLFIMTDTKRVNVLPSPTPNITGDSELCSGTATIDGGADVGGGNFASYRWYNINNPATTLGTGRTYTATAAGTYIVTVSNGGCEDSDTTTIGQGESMGITILQDAFEICGSAPSISIPYTVTYGTPQTYSLSYDAAALAAGFVNVSNIPITPADLFVALPSTVAAGAYNATVTISSGSGCTADFTAPFTINVKMDPTDLMQQKWNDVIALYNQYYNGGLEFVAYQWYKNGQELQGENHSYIYLTNDMLRSTDRYSVYLTMADGTQFMTCDFIPVDKPNDIGFPTLVTVNQIISVRGIEESYNVNIIGVNGNMWSQQSLSPQNPTLTMPGVRGMYIIRLQNDNSARNYKVVVE